MKKNIKILLGISAVLTTVGAIQLGLIGFFNFNLAQAILGWLPGGVRALHIIIGLSAIPTIVIAIRKMLD